MIISRETFPNRDERTETEKEKMKGRV